MSQNRYEDILYLPHPVSKERPQMKISDRAAQFSPFAALTGYHEAVEETRRLTDSFKELDESRKEGLNHKLQFVLTQEESRMLTITYFQPDAKKEGGEYVTTTGRIKRIDTYEQCLVLEDETVIPMEYLYEIEIK